MKKKMSIRFKIVDILYILGMIVPFLCLMVLKVYTNSLNYNPEASISDNIQGALIYKEIPIYENCPRFLNLIISEAQVNSVAVIIAIFFLCLYFTFALLNAEQFFQRNREVFSYNGKHFDIGIGGSGFPT